MRIAISNLIDVELVEHMLRKPQKILMVHLKDSVQY